MVRVTVTIEGDIDEVVAAIRQMAGRGAEPLTGGEVIAGEEAVDAAVGGADGASTRDGESSPEELAVTAELDRPKWNASYTTTFWRYLSATARQAMVRVSQSPDYTEKRAQLMDELNLTQRELSGSLSSQGHSMNRLRRRRGGVDLPRPMTYDKVADVYVLDSNFAGALRLMQVD